MATLKRQAKTLNLQEALQNKMMPNYVDKYAVNRFEPHIIEIVLLSDDLLGEKPYYGHGTADFRDNVAEGVELMEVKSPSHIFHM
jgi:hypothetical protein